MSDRPEVIVVDGLRETTEVLRAVLEPRGVTVTCQPAVPVADASDTARVRVLVLHDDPPTSCDGPRVIVGRIRANRVADEQQHRALPQPFHYADLIDAIDAIVDARAA